MAQLAQLNVASLLTYTLLILISQERRVDLFILLMDPLLGAIDFIDCLTYHGFG